MPSLLIPTSPGCSRFQLHLPSVNLATSYFTLKTFSKLSTIIQRQFSSSPVQQHSDVRRLPRYPRRLRQKSAIIYKFILPRRPRLRPHVSMASHGTPTWADEPFASLLPVGPRGRSRARLGQSLQPLGAFYVPPPFGGTRASGDKWTDCIVSDHMRACVNIHSVFGARAR